MDRAGVAATLVDRPSFVYEPARDEFVSDAGVVIATLTRTSGSLTRADGRVARRRLLLCGDASGRGAWWLVYGQRVGGDAHVVRDDAGDVVGVVDRRRRGVRTSGGVDVAFRSADARSWLAVADGVVATISQTRRSSSVWSETIWRLDFDAFAPADVRVLLMAAIVPFTADRIAG